MRRLISIAGLALLIVALVLFWKVDHKLMYGLLLFWLSDNLADSLLVDNVKEDLLAVMRDLDRSLRGA
jgi:hypothetical protein